MSDRIVHNGILSLTMCVLLAAEVLNDNVICTRNEVISKTRPRTVIVQYKETYWDYYCRGYYSSYSKCYRERYKTRSQIEQESYTQLEIKQYCCTGYENKNMDTDVLECIPVCDFTCANGKCAKPNFCECNPGYSKQSGTENICEPVCSEQCVHGSCSRPEFCSCDLGYEHNSSSPYVCAPVCTKTCINADCTSPDVCTCLRSYAKTLREPHKCHAVCSRHCLNGVCSEPESCSCFEGYEKDNSTWNVCKPVCAEGCSNGHCTAPSECTCFDGFEKMSRNTCVPKCSQKCVNGLCSFPETCSCLDGYQSAPDDPYSCFPICSPGCVNGNCTEPGRCECFLGFQGTDDPLVCQPDCSDGCVNGICSRPEECTCLWGFTKEGNSSNCTQQEDQNLDCSFSNKLEHRGFDKHCFNLSNELSLTNSGNCIILYILTSYIAESENTIVFTCEGVSDLKLSENIFQIRLDCIAELLTTKVERNSGSDELTNTSTNSEDSTETPGSVTQPWETPFITDKSVSPEDYELESPSEGSQIYTAHEESFEERGFKIIYDGISPDENKFSGLPLELKVNMKFLPLIKNTYLTQDYITTLKKEWCLCHQNKQNWTICASSPLKLSLCQCEPKKSMLQMEDTGITSLIKTAFKFVLLSLAVVVIGYIVYLKWTRCQSGSYVANGMNESDPCEPVLSINLNDLDAVE